MPTKCFLSFHYTADNWRVSQIKEMGSIEEQPLLTANKWEEVEKAGEQAIKDWIANNMKDKKCLIVLIGAKTADRKWVDYEIKHAWEKGKGVLGIHIHKLKDNEGNQTTKGANPFAGFTVSGKPLTNWAKTYDPPFSDSKQVYNYIKDNIDGWVQAAIKLRA